MGNHRTRAVLLFVVVASFSVLIFGGVRIQQYKPPIPGRVLAPDGQVLFTGEDIIRGQKLYLSRGGQHMGSIWGHGAYLAPDWSADAVHRIGIVAAGIAAGRPVDGSTPFTQQDLEALPAPERARIEALVAQELRQNRYDATTDALTLSPAQAAAWPILAAHYTRLFQQGDPEAGVHPGVVQSDDEGRLLTAFFTWTAWAAMTVRPGETYTYTANWPYDPLVGNTPLPGALVWSIVSVVLLIAGVAFAIWWYLARLSGEDRPEIRPLAPPVPTGSQQATRFYFLAVVALFAVQAILGSTTGHYAVEGNALFGLDMRQVLPYPVARTWHVQLSVFWIATSWLATGLFIGPFVSGREPSGQARWTWILLGALVLVVVGSLGGTWASIMGRIGGDAFWFGNQGYEYIELGRVWQVALLGGMILWLLLVYRAIRPVLAQEEDRGGLTHLLLYSAVSIPLFYSAGLFYTPGTHMSVADYWRWWVVHLWVENFFEVFATVVLAFVLSRLGAVREKTALQAVYASILLYLGAGIIGTFHHLYFAGTPLFITALGATFSALEIIPLALLGFEVVGTLRLAHSGGHATPFRWPLLFFVAVAFWNLVGAGVFGFLINPPIVLYYAQGLNTTPIHSHGALFGVYGFLAIALMLFSLRHILHPAAWSDRLLKVAFWGLNLGLAGMIALSLAPAGFYQFVEAIRHGTWWARSPAVTQSEFIRTVTWLRVLPDLVFFVGVGALCAFVIRGIILDVRLRRSGGKEV
ncbi:MAG TPA: nitric-oxide reductase large subunit [Myxococcota bacterium]|nr:nitric-oxide reductase large subunit [Myxococcota bacterium]HQK51426.1 nitric-oxide reductase large subunit [Myxococcota bacterium]